MLTTRERRQCHLMQQEIHILILFPFRSSLGWKVTVATKSSRVWVGAIGTGGFVPELTWIADEQPRWRCAEWDHVLLLERVFARGSSWLTR